MEIADKLKNMTKDKKRVTVITALGLCGLFLIMLSSVVPDDKDSSTNGKAVPAKAEGVDTEAYCRETEQKLADFLSSIDGAGRVRVYLTVGSSERYVYAEEGRASSSGDKTEEERKYVMTDSENGRSALALTVKCPEITGAVVACSGCGDPVVCEKIYKAVSAALDIPTGKIYVTKLE